MRSHLAWCLLTGLMLSGVSWGDSSAAPVTQRQFQAVDARGEQTYQAAEKVVLEGIVLHQPADMLDPTPDDTIGQTYNLGGQWQLFFQGEGDDHAGTAVFLGQLYDNLPWVETGGYSNEEFIAELARLNAAGFSPGDRIRVTGWFLSYKGKMNVNEQHDKHPGRDFTIELLARGAGLPRPEAVTLDQLKDDQDRFIFDADRRHGGEYYQGCLIKIERVRFAEAGGWDADGEVTVTDGRRTLPVKLGRGRGLYRGSNNLREPFDVIGILDQDSVRLTDGYRLYVTNYDGNGRVLACREHRMADRPGDTNLNGAVDFIDLARLAADWLSTEDP